MSHREEDVARVCAAWERVSPHKQAIIQRIERPQATVGTSLSPVLRRQWEELQAKRAPERHGEQVDLALDALFAALDQLCNDLPEPEKSLDPPWGGTEGP